MIEADIDEDPTPASSRCATHAGMVSRIVDLTPTIKGISMRLPEPIAFQAGQYVQLRLPGRASRRFDRQQPSHDGPAEVVVKHRAHRAGRAPPRPA